MRISRIQRRLPCYNIRLSTRHSPRLLEHLPENIQVGIYWYSNIRGDEVIGIEFLRRAGERPEAVEDGDHDEEHEGEPGCVGLEGGAKFEGGAVDIAVAEGGVESDVGDADGHPGKEDGDCG